MDHSERACGQAVSWLVTGLTCWQITLWGMFSYLQKIPSENCNSKVPLCFLIPQLIFYFFHIWKQHRINELGWDKKQKEKRKDKIDLGVPKMSPEPLQVHPHVCNSVSGTASNWPQRHTSIKQPLCWWHNHCFSGCQLYPSRKHGFEPLSRMLTILERGSRIVPLSRVGQKAVNTGLNRLFSGRWVVPGLNNHHALQSGMTKVIKERGVLIGHGALLELNACSQKAE